MSTDEQQRVLEAFMKHADAVSQIIRVESLRCGLDDRTAKRLADRVTHWLVFGQPVGCGYCGRPGHDVEDCTAEVTPFDGLDSLVREWGAS